MHIPALDGLRGIAAYVVFLSHYTLISGFANGLFGNGGGQISVMIFFVISGFLMGHLYGAGEVSCSLVFTYVRRRIARVLPLYYFMVMAAFIIGILLPNLNIGYPVNINNIDDHLFLIRGIGAFWTIPVEVQFYGIFVVMWVLFSRARHLESVLIVVLLILIAENPRWLSPISHMRILTSVLSFFLIGVLISRLSNFRRNPIFDVLFVFAACSVLLLFPQIAALIEGKKSLPVTR